MNSLCVPKGKSLANKEKKSIECWIFDKAQGCFLLLKCPETEKHKEYWQPVTGGIETTESKHDACIREVHEETGLRVEEKDLIKLIDRFSVYGEKINLFKTVFISIQEDVTVTISDEHTGYRWVAPEMVEQMLLWGSNKSTFGLVTRYLKLGL